jgi:putative transposon-encoded protein
VLAKVPRKKVIESRRWKRVVALVLRNNLEVVAEKRGGQYGNVARLVVYTSYVVWAVLVWMQLNIAAI